MFVCGFVEQSNLRLLKDELKDRASLVPDCSLLAGSELEVEKGLLYMFSHSPSHELCFRIKLKASQVQFPIVETVDLNDPDQAADWALNNRVDCPQHFQLLFKDSPNACHSEEKLESYRQDSEHICSSQVHSPKKPRFFDDQTEEFLRKSKRHTEDRLKQLERESSLRRSSLIHSEICLTHNSEPRFEQTLTSSPVNPNTATSQMINNFGELESTALVQSALTAKEVGQVLPRNPRLCSRSKHCLRFCTIELLDSRAGSRRR